MHFLAFFFFFKIWRQDLKGAFRREGGGMFTSLHPRLSWQTDMPVFHRFFCGGLFGRHVLVLYLRCWYYTNSLFLSDKNFGRVLLSICGEQVYWIKRVQTASLILYFGAWWSIATEACIIIILIGGCGDLKKLVCHDSTYYQSNVVHWELMEPRYHKSTYFWFKMLDSEIWMSWYVLMAHIVCLMLYVWN